MASDMYSGYLDVTETKKLHYVFVESMGNPRSDPVVIWLNGGPGCSSLLGLFQENGPIYVDTGVMEMVDLPWNRRANMLYLEQPAGVGFTVSNGSSEWVYNDMLASEEAYKALDHWYKKFPEFVGNDLYISGESYGGIYVPYLSWQVLQNNLRADFDPRVQVMKLKGFLVGNGATQWDFDVSPSFPDTLYGFNMIPTPLIEYLHNNNCTFYFNDFRNHSGPAGCEDAMNQVFNLTEGVWWYDLYLPNRELKSDGPRLGKTMINGEEKTYKRGYTMAEYTPWLKNLFPETSSFHTAVNAAGLSDYLNREDVREALHISPDAPAFDFCNNYINEQWKY